MESRVKPQNYFQVSGWMLQELKLSGNELMVFAIIYGFSQDGNSKFTGSLKYLQDLTGASRTTIITALNNLVEKGYVKKDTTENNGILSNTYKSVRGVQNLYGGVQKQNEGSTETVPPPGTESVPNNISSNNNSIDTGSATPPIELTQEEKQFNAFTDWIKNKAVNLAKMKEPLTSEELQKLLSNYPKEIVFEVFQQMHNKPDLVKKYTSAYLTANNWIKRHLQSSQNDLFNGQSNEEKKRQAAEQRTREFQRDR